MTASPAWHHAGVDAAMAAAAELTGMEVVYLGLHGERTSTFARVLGGEDWTGVEESATSPRTDTLCSRMLAGAPPATAHAAAEPAYRDAGMVTGLGVCSYVGVPVRDGAGRVVATLCGIDRRHVAVAPHVVEVLASLARVVSAQLGEHAGDVVVRRDASGHWAVVAPADEAPDDDVASAVALAALLGEEVAPDVAPEPAEDEAARLRAAVAQLEAALHTRVEAEQALGVLVERHAETPREAFRRLHDGG